MPALGRAWVAGWLISRGSPPTTTEPWGLRIDLGAPGHPVRHVLLDADDATVRALADSVLVPTTSIKGFTASADLARLLTPHWTPDPPEVLMSTTLQPVDAHLIPGYRISIERTLAVTHACVTAHDGSVAAQGQVAVTGGTCVFDQITTAPGHRRRWLGAAVMATLATAAADLGAMTGILGATTQGRALYEALGWTVAGPLSSFVYKRVPLLISSDHLFTFLSVLTTFAPEMSELNGQN